MTPPVGGGVVPEDRDTACELLMQVRGDTSRLTPEQVEAVRRLYGLPYHGRDPVDLQEANALYQRYCDGEISLSDETIEVCLRIQGAAIAEKNQEVKEVMNTPETTPPAPASSPVPLEEALRITDEEDQRARELLEEIDHAEEERARHGALCAELRSADRTDLGNCERLVRRFGRDIRFNHPSKTWHVWDGRRWKKDEQGRIQGLAKRTVRYIGDEAGLIEGDTERSEMWRWAAASQNQSRVEAAIKLARDEVSILPEDLDAQKHLLNLQNGTLDLSTFSLQPHSREHLCSRMAGIRFDPEASCPLWLNHLDLIFGGDAAFIRDFQMMAGYSLISDNPEQVFFILHGSGKNGKTVTVSTLSRIMGDYAMNMAAESLMIRKNSEAPRSDIVQLVGARLITAAESDSSHRLSESLIKSLTGGDVITARTLYQIERQYRITGKIWFSTNHRPVIKGTDTAIWRRVWLVPFEVEIPEEKRDRQILEKLAAEGSGILNWMLEGLKRYQENGDRLSMPERVALANENYRQDSDVIGQFINDSCILDLRPESTTARAALYEVYVAWCKQQGEGSLSNRSFASRLQERGVTTKKVRGTRYWIGIRERSSSEVGLEGGQGAIGDTGLEESPYENNIKKVLETPARKSPLPPKKAEGVS